MRNLTLACNYAMAFIGVPYKWGGSNPISGFDCSGFVQEILASIKMDPPGDQSAQALYDYFMANGGTLLSSPKQGAIVFYGKSLKQISHVVFSLDDAGSCIGADGGGSTTVDKTSADHANAFIKIRAFDYRTDFVAIVMPNY